MGRVIGKQGATINKIRESSGARIDAEDRNEDQCEFKISGNPDAVERAKTMILDIAEKSAVGTEAGRVGGTDDTDARSGNTVSDTLEFSVSLMGGIIGSRGAKISEVRQQSGAKVQVEKLEDRCKVQISGMPEQVDRARNMIQALAEEGQNVQTTAGSDGAQSGEKGRGDNWSSSSGGGNNISDTLKFPVSATGRIIGSRGAQISEVRQQSGAKVQVEKLDDCCKVQVSGTPQQVERAKVLIHNLADEGQSTHRRSEAEHQMEVPQSMVGRVIGKGGETIQRLQKDTGARIDVNTNGGDPCIVRISGSHEAVSNVRFLISEILDRGGHNPDKSRSSQGSLASGGPWGSNADANSIWGASSLLGGLTGPYARAFTEGPLLRGDTDEWQTSWSGMWGSGPSNKCSLSSNGLWGYPPANIPEREHNYTPDSTKRFEPKSRHEIDLDEL